MKYLFGDGTESELSLNYLEYLRGALEFSSSVLEGDVIVARQESKAEKARKNTDDEMAQLESVENKLTATVDRIKQETTADVAKNCVVSFYTLAQREIERAKEATQSKLSQSLNEVSQEIATQRAANEHHMEKLLLRHDLPETDCWVDATAKEDGGFDATLMGESELGVEFTMDLAIPGKNLFSRALKLERIDSDLAIKVPKSAGWGRKSVKIRTVKLAKDYVVGVRHVGDELVIEVRNAPFDGQSGVDIAFIKDRIRLTQIEKREASDPFTADAEDLPKLHALREWITDALEELAKSRRALREVKFGGVPLCDHVTPSKLVRELVDRMIPVVTDIKRHSLAPGELVLKRVLSDDKREEVFASIADLKAIVETLPGEQRDVFAPLGLWEGGNVGSFDPKPVRDKIDKPDFGKKPFEGLGAKDDVDAGDGETNAGDDPVLLNAKTNEFPVEKQTKSEDEEEESDRDGDDDEEISNAYGDDDKEISSVDGDEDVEISDSDVDDDDLLNGDSEDDDDLELSVSDMDEDDIMDTESKDDDGTPLPDSSVESNPSPSLAMPPLSDQLRRPTLPRPSTAPPSPKSASKKPSVIPLPRKS